MLQNRLAHSNQSPDDNFRALFDTVNVGNETKEIQKNLIKEIEKYFSYETMQESPFRFSFVISPFRMNKPIRGYVVKLVDQIQPTNNAGEYRLKFYNYIGVKYSGEKEELNYLDAMHLERGASVQISTIKLEAPSIIIEEKGRYWDTYKLHTYGYWAWERLADSLPYEYESIEAN